MPPTHPVAVRGTILRRAAARVAGRPHPAGGGRRATGRGPRVLPAAGVVACVMASAASSSGRDGPASWSVAARLPHTQVVTLGPSGRGILAGLYDESAAVRPRVVVVGEGGDVTTVPLHHGDGYAASARWYSLQATGDRLLALGGAPGGAHSNVRWTIWRGTYRGLTDEPQPFETFGGEDAGGLVGATRTAGSDLVAGSWASTGVGNDVTTWVPRGRRWVRQRSTGTPLARTATSLPLAAAVAATSDAVVVAGWRVDLAEGVTRRPVLWWAPRAEGPWTQVDLPVRGPGGQATRLACGADRCLALGEREGVLVGWWVSTGSGAPRVRAAALPTVAVQATALVTPAVSGATAALVVPRANRSDVLVVSDTGVEWRAGPPGAATAVTIADADVAVATRDGSDATIWRTPMGEPPS